MQLQRGVLPSIALLLCIAIYFLLPRWPAPSYVLTLQTRMGPSWLGGRSVYGVTPQQVVTYRRELERRLQYLEANRANFAQPGMLGHLWMLFSAVWPCAPLERIGNVMDGGKWTCDIDGVVAGPDCTVFSLGSNGETAFEEAVLDRAPHCKVHTFDHTLTPEKRAKVDSVPAILFHALGFTSERKLAAAEQNGRELGGYPATSFTSLERSMTTNDVTWVDILKIDIEGEEWEVFSELLARNDTIPITQVYIEFHCCIPNHPALGRLCPGDRSSAEFFTACPSDIVRADFLAAFFTSMDRHGFRAYRSEMNPYDATNSIEYAFVQTDAQGRMVTRRHHSQIVVH